MTDENKNQPPSGGATPPAQNSDGSKQVPIAELHREREKRQGLQAELDQLKEQMNQLRFGEFQPGQQQQRQPIPQQAPDPVQQLEQLWDQNPRTAVQTEIQMALDWYDRVNNEVNAQVDNALQKHADFKDFQHHVRAWVNRLPAAQRAKPGIVELAYHAIKGQNIDALLKKAQEEAIQKYKAGDFGTPPDGGGLPPSGGGQGNLNDQQRAAAAAMGVSEEDYFKNLKGS